MRGVTSVNNPAHPPGSSVDKVASEADLKPLDSPSYVAQTSAKGSTSATQLEELSSALEEDGK